MIVSRCKLYNGGEVKVIDGEIPRNLIPTLRMNLLGVKRFPRKGKAKMAKPRLKVRNGEDFSYIKCGTLLLYQPMAGKKTLLVSPIESGCSRIETLPTRQRWNETLYDA
ncbi:hypothetical protein Tco_0465593 [Tanacetum coccineum]